jgi:hypothetical protein
MPDLITISKDELTEITEGIARKLRLESVSKWMEEPVLRWKLRDCNNVPCSRKTIDRLIDDNGLTVSRIGNKRFFKTSEIDKLFENSIIHTAYKKSA